MEQYRFQSLNAKLYSIYFNASLHYTKTFLVRASITIRTQAHYMKTMSKLFNKSDVKKVGFHFSAVFF